MNFRTRNALVILTVIGLSLSCSPVKEVDLVGNWVVSDTPNDLVSQSHQTRLIVNSDGSFSAYEIPGPLFGRNEPVSGEGQWVLLGESTDGIAEWLDLYWEGNQTVQLTLQRRLEGTVMVPSDSRTEVYVYGGHEGPTMYFYVGDPDDHAQVYMQKE